MLGCGRSNFDAVTDGNGTGSDDDAGADASATVTPRCSVPARPDVSNPRVTLGCDAILATQELTSGGVIRFDCATGVKLGAPMIINNDTVIDGRGVVFDGQDITQILRISANARVTMLDVTVTRGASTDSGAGVRIDAGTLVAFDSTFSENNGPAPTAAISGGGIAAIPNASFLEIYGSTFTNNSSPSGGAILAYAGLTVVNTTFDGNVATGAGGAAGTGGDGAAVHMVGPGDTTLCGVTLTSNLGGGIGGAMTIISTDNSSVVQMTDIVMDDNRASGGGAAYLQGLASLTMQRVSVTSNSAAGGGAGLWLQGPGTVNAENVSIIGNRADGGPGGGLYVNGVSGAFAFSTIADNVGNCAGCAAAAVLGGGMLDYEATIIVDNTSMTTPAACSETGMNRGATYQWPGETPACATGVTVTDPFLDPRALVTGPAGTLLVRRPSSGSPANAVVTSGCPADDVLGRPRATPCAAGAVEPL